jgi:putative chitinase
MTDFNKVLLAIAPQGKATIRSGFAAALLAAIAHADLTTSLRLAHFLAQCAHESSGFTTTTEYASGAAYEGRRDLGNVQKGDGRRFKGRGLLQITGRANYERYGKAFGLDLIGNPDAAAEFSAAALTAAEYWRDHDLNRFADRDDGRSVTRGVNGGLNGLESRMVYLARSKRALADLKDALRAGAVEENQKATAKSGSAGAASVTAAVSLASLHTAAHSSISPLVAGLLGLIAVVAVAWLIVSIHRHKRAAAALTSAALGV